SSLYTVWFVRNEHHGLPRAAATVPSSADRDRENRRAHRPVSDLPRPSAPTARGTSAGMVNFASFIAVAQWLTLCRAANLAEPGGLSAPSARLSCATRRVFAGSPRARVHPLHPSTPCAQLRNPRSCQRHCAGNLTSLGWVPPCLRLLDHNLPMLEHKQDVL